MASKNFNQRGFAALFVALVVLAIIFGIAMSMSVFAIRHKKISQNYIKSAQAYFAAESGLEDMLLRLRNGMAWSSPYVLSVGDANATTTVSDMIGGSRTITAQGNSVGKIRNIAAVYELSTTKAQFFFGAQIGDGGIELGNNSIINGNVFSNGNISAQAGSQINGTVKVAGNGNTISGANITGSAYVDICGSSAISDVLYAQTQTGCTFRSFVPSSPLGPAALPITQTDIDQWKAEATSGGTIGAQNFSSGIHRLGPVKIAGNLIVAGSAELIMEGTIWVTGDITISNNAKAHLDSPYGTLSGHIISDGQIVLQNNTISSGSGAPGSYLMYLSTSLIDPAIKTQNNAVADILYATGQKIEIQNNAQLREVTGYGVRITNNAVLNYEIGLQDTSFISGPSAGWRVANWREIE